jgi:hypothetical protein
MPQLAGKFQPAQAGQHHIQQDEIEAAVFGETQSTHAVVRDFDFVRFLAKTAHEQARHFEIVLYDQDVHG